MLRSQVCICVYLQLGDDTQVIAGSGFESMKEYVEYIVPVINTIWSSRCNIFIRFHPAAINDEARAVNAFDSLSVMDFIRGIPNVYISEMSWQDAAYSCEAIFGINSSSLFETWLFNQNIDLYLSGLAGWYPSKELKEKFQKEKLTHKFYYKCSKNALEGMALLTFTGYIHYMENGAKSIIPLLEHSLTYSLVSEVFSALSLSVKDPSNTLRHAPRQAAVSIHKAASSIYKYKLSVSSLCCLLEEISICEDSPKKYLNLELVFEHWLKSEWDCVIEEGVCILEVKRASDQNVEFEIQVNSILNRFSLNYLDVYFFSRLDNYCVCKRRAVIDNENLPLSLSFSIPSYEPELLLDPCLDYNLVCVFTTNLQEKVISVVFT